MTLSVARNIEQLTSGSTSSIVRTGLGFQPKFAIVRWNRIDATGASSQELQMGVGFVAASQNHCVAHDSVDGRTATTRNSGVVHNTSSIVELDAVSGATPSGLASVTLDADGYTINISDAFRFTFKVEVTCFGGTSIDVVVGSRTSPVTGGNFNTTVTGITPNLLLVAHSGSRVATLATVNNSNAVGLGFGAAMSSSNRWNLYGGVDGQVTVSVSQGIVRTDRVATFVQGAAIESTLDFVSFAADTFTLNKAGADTSRASCFIYAAIQIDQAAVGTFTAQTATGNFSKTGVGFQGKCLFSVCRPDATATESALNTGAEGSEISSGIAISSTDRQALWNLTYGGITLSGGTPSDTFNGRRTDAFLVNYDRTAANTASIVGEIDFVSWDSDGFTLNQVDADAQATLIPFVVFGETGGGGGGGNEALLRRYRNNHLGAMV